MDTLYVRLMHSRSPDVDKSRSGCGVVIFFRAITCEDGISCGSQKYFVLDEWI
ncbi:hypothetical protein M3629_25595 [Paenibacillus polysaccharolyticus]|nr:hypothetical protein [Paenibacillus polysaccharolyticus]